MDKYIGKMLDDRYEILELVGVGGMAVVYRARCHKLNRDVAVKIMREELARDEEFRSRFHEESISVASLSHPNIVQVFDVSKGETEYIVMELIDGITLKEYMEKRGALTWKEVTFFSMQIAKALEHAHAHEVIHRDIKPQNIMLLRDGTVKVTDFGIAHHAAQKTNKLAEAIGSVHYVSPEQARGSAIDGRADIYSFGVVMYEMLTGRLPFEGDTPVSIALQHINSVPLLPSDYVEGIPQALEAITMRAMCANLNHRYTFASEVLADLEAFSKNPNMTLPMDHVLLPAEEPLVIEPADESVPEQGDVTRKLAGTELEDAVKKFDSTAEPAEEKKEEISVPAGAGKRLIQKPKKEKKPVEQKVEAPAKPSWKERRYEKKKEKYSYQGIRISLMFSILCALVFLAGSSFFLYSIIDPFGTQTVEKLSVPRLTGMDYDELLTNTAYYEGFSIYLSESSYNDTVPAGQIITQSPAPGRSGQDGDVISVTVSLGAKSSKMDNYIAMTYRMANVKLSRLGLHTTRVDEHSETVEPGYIIRTVPAAGQPVPDGAEVLIYVSKGPEPRYTIVPDVTGWSVAQATEELEEAKLILAPLQYEDSAYPTGTVLFQSLPQDSSVLEYSEIILTVSQQMRDKVSIPYTFALMEELTGNIQVMVTVDGVIQYSGNHTAFDGSVMVALTAEPGTHSVVVTQNGIVTESFYANFQ